MRRLPGTDLSRAGGAFSRSEPLFSRVGRSVAPGCPQLLSRAQGEGSTTHVRGAAYTGGSIEQAAFYIGRCTFLPRCLALAELGLLSGYRMLPPETQPL